MSSSSSPCAACKLQRRKCTQECVFAPYFPPDQPQKFANIHKVFGASNVSKLLNELNASQREDAVNSLAYEAEYRLRDPVYGCVGLISILQQRLKQVQRDLNTAKRELATYIGPNALAPLIPQTGFMQHPNHPSSSGVMQYNMQPMMMGVPMGLPNSNQLIIRDQQIHQSHPQQQLIESHQLMIGEADLIGSYEQQHQNPQQFDLMRFNGFESGGPVTATGFHQINATPAAGISPSLGLGAYDNPYPIQQQPSQQEQQHCHPHHHLHHPDHHDHHIQLQPQLLLQQQQQLPQQQIQHQQPPPQPETPQQQQQRATSDEGGRSVGPLC
ncbi:PREDICTED: LOB domain-containing protein 36 [Ipomoea nil]|uniref:LOB domain-containing protein 36 n=1 Tax=Ipomoea nil TaxID=35883 RepID=UPI00090096FE|nr:PREDICTED: LOB domain-containing protein 36 [Ipomoea nil]